MAWTTVSRSFVVITSYSIHYTKLYEFADQSQTSVKVDILLKADLPYIVEEKPDRLGIILKGSQAALEQTAGAGLVADEPGQRNNFV